MASILAQPLPPAVPDKWGQLVEVTEGAMAPNQAEWPVHFPSDCPDGTTNDTNGAVFRFINGGPKDFLSWLELNVGSGSDCRRAALSCFVTLQEAEDIRDVSPIHGSDQIAQADLTPIQGKIKQTGNNPGHHSLWLRTQHHQACRTLFGNIVS
jgi:hypothetical protein